VWKLSFVLNRCFRAVVEPLARLSPIVALLVISMVTGVLLLLIFGATSNQRAIKRTKDKIKAHLLEILLFNDNLRVVFRAQGSVLIHALKYLGLAVVPMLAIIVPMALIVTQSDHFFQSKPLEPDDAVTVSVTLEQWDPELAESISISVPNGLAVETPALRIPETREIAWKLRAPEPDPRSSARSSTLPNPLLKETRRWNRSRWSMRRPACDSDPFARTGLYTSSFSLWFSRLYSSRCSRLKSNGVSRALLQPSALRLRTRRGCLQTFFLHY